MKKILFIICNYNAHASGALGESLKRLQDIKDDNIVISYFDNGSRDGSADMLQEYYKSGLIDLLVLSKKNMGKAYAMNNLFITAMQMYNVSGQDVLISMDSDISIMDRSFPSQVRSIFAEPGVKYLGYTYFSDYEMKTKSNYNCYKNTEVEIIDGRHYDVLENQHGLGGGILAMPASRFSAVNGYNQHLGPKGTPAIYGGDDAVLLRDLFLAFPNEKALCCTEQMIVHPENDDEEYKQWKKEVIKSMCKNGFKNEALPLKGFYD